MESLLETKTKSASISTKLREVASYCVAFFCPLWKARQARELREKRGETVVTWSSALIYMILVHKMIKWTEKFLFLNFFFVTQVYFLTEVNTQKKEKSLPYVLFLVVKMEVTSTRKTLGKRIKKNGFPLDGKWFRKEKLYQIYMVHLYQRFM